MSTNAAADQEAQTVSVSQRIVTAVADELDAEETALDPLYQAVDPDALERLFDSGQRAGFSTPDEVVFTYCGCEVQITGDGEVHATELA